MNKYIKKYYWKLHKMIFSKNFFLKVIYAFILTLKSQEQIHGSTMLNMEKKKEEQTAIFLMMIFPVMIIFHFIMM